MKQISRREFATLTVAGTAMSRVASPFARGLAPVAATVTAAEIVARIKKQIGGAWDSDDIDAFKIGDPSTVVTGVVTTSMATLDVLQKAVQAGANLIITATPTFYSRADLSTPGGRGLGAGGRGQIPARGAGPAPPSPATISGPGTGASAPMPPAPTLPSSVVPTPQRGGAAAPPAAPPPDPVFAGKNDFIARHKLVVFRMGQHWTQREPDPRAVGLATAMGWTRYKAGNDALRYDVPPITLDALASQLKKALNTRGGIRAVGDPTATVRRIGLLPGFTTIQASIAMMPSVDVIVTGEVQEWESASYAQDVAFAGIKKGFISIGRVVNEAPGMQVCADWLKTIVPEVPVRFVTAGDLYWRPL
ncbi:MAG: Nif3-like dinuclear metal center hexameric protein [Acidobacteriota bacterium]